MKKSSGKYLEITNVLRQEILAGHYEDSERFPSEVALSRRFGASRPTIERALRALKAERLLDARVGSGAFITPYARRAGGILSVIAPDYQRIDFFTDLCNHIVTAGRAEGYDVQIGDSSVSDSLPRGDWAVAVANACVKRKVAGVLLEPVDLVARSSEATEATLKIFARHKIPVVLLDRDYIDTPARSAYDLIGIDNIRAGYRLGLHMIDAGARQIRFLTQADYAATIRARIHGVEMACHNRGLPRNAFAVMTVNTEDTANFEKQIREARKVDAFVCRNDPLAARLLQTLTKLKRRVPEDVLVAGFDDAKIANLLNPPLTTIRQPIADLAEAAVDALLQRIRKPTLPPRMILLDAPLLIRDSTTPDKTSPTSSSARPSSARR